MKSIALFLMVLGVSSFLFFFRLGDRPLRNPDEGRYAEIAKEMVQRGDWVEPRLYGVDYLKKPVLFYWLIALSFKVFGFTEWAARLVPAFFGVLGVLGTFLFARRILNEKTACWASLILLSNFFYLQVGRYLVIDMVFSFFVFTALYAFYLATTETRHNTFYVIVFYSCVSLSFLAKGFIGVIIPFVTIALYALMTRQVTRVLRRMRWVTGLVISGLWVAPWMIAIAKREPEFFSFFFFHENVARFVSSSFEHQEPWYFYFAFMLVVFIPWIFFFQPLKRVLSFDDSARSRRLFLWIAGTALVVFFSLSKAKLATYILPAIPFLSMVIAEAWVIWASQTPAAPFSRKRSAVPLVALALASLLYESGLFIYARQHPSDFVKDTLTCLQWLGGIFFVGSMAGIICVLRRSVRGLFYTLITIFVLAFFPVQIAMERSNPNYSTKHFAQTLNPLLTEQDLVVIYGNPGPLYDFRFYLKYPVLLIGLEGEFHLSKEDDDLNEQYISIEKFDDLLTGHKRVYCLTRKSELQNIPARLTKNIAVIKEDRRKILFHVSPSL